MEIFYEQIPLPEEKTFIIREFWNDKLSFPFHNHPFYELNLITNVSGKRIVGNQISYFEEFDLSLIGPDLPHQFIDEDNILRTEKSRSIVLQFHSNLLPSSLIQRDDFFKINQLLQNARRGISFRKNALQKYEPLLNRLMTTKSMDGFMLFLDLLNHLSQDKDFIYLSDMLLPENSLPKGMEKTNVVFEYIYANYTSEISLAKAASIINLSKSAFSHFFKKRVNKTFSTFINELRVSHASRLLRETEIPIIEICFQSGFNNLSYFNRQFKLITKMSPRNYRSELTYKK